MKPPFKRTRRPASLLDVVALAVPAVGLDSGLRARGTQVAAYGLATSHETERRSYETPKKYGIGQIEVSKALNMSKKNLWFLEVFGRILG